MTCRLYLVPRFSTPAFFRRLSAGSVGALAMANVNLSGNKLEYHYVCDTSKLSAKLMCAICSEPLVSPSKTPCKHTFCMGCLKQHTDRSATCPICRATLSIGQLQEVDDTLTALLDELEVYCEHRGLGCDWKGPRGNIEEHTRRTCEKVLEMEPRKLMAALNPAEADVLVLRVGGRVFETTSTTLTSREPTSLLADLARNHKSLHRTAQGAVIVEADSKVFDHILAWMRLGLVPAGLPQHLHERLTLQAKQFRLVVLVDALERKALQSTTERLPLPVLYKLLLRKWDSPLHLPGVNLSGYNLRGVQFAGANLCGANLRGADLRGAGLSETNLSGADLSEARLSSAAGKGSKPPQVQETRWLCKVRSEAAYLDISKRQDAPFSYFLVCSACKQPTDDCMK